MKRLGFLACGLLLAVACGSNNNGGKMDAPPDSKVFMDGSGSASATFTTFVIDLVLNHGSDATPAAFASFQNLPDPDGDTNNVHAYDSLF